MVIAEVNRAEGHTSDLRNKKKNQGIGRQINNLFTFVI